VKNGPIWLNHGEASDEKNPFSFRVHLLT
jgi:hypothetical protein